ncbi:MAG: PKD domain-containing protein [Bacteroidetes bacterium]|nr:PKD domain-containing protein [Bacteroidota bacterium]
MIAGNCTSYYCDTIYLGQGGCFAAFSYTGNQNTITFTNLSSNNTTNWLWDFGDSNSSTQFSPQHTYANSGTYTVCLISSDSNGCSDTVCMPIQVGSMFGCQASFTYTVGMNGVVTFTNTSQTNNQLVTYQWSFGDGTSDTATNPIHQYNSFGPYIVCLTVIGPNCQSTYCDSVVLNNGGGCSASFYATPDTSGMGFQFTNTSQGGNAQYLWTFGDNTSSTLMNPSHTYAQPGTYNVCLTIVTINGCTDTYCQNVVALQAAPCTPSFTYVQDSITGVITFVFDTTNCPVSMIIWSFGDSTFFSASGSVVQYTYADSGTYIVCVTYVIGNNTYTYCDTIYANKLGAMSITEVTLQDVIKLSPNPSSNGMVKIISSQPISQLNIKVTDITGKLILENNKQLTGAGHENFLDLSAYENGMYYLLFTADGKQTSQTLIIMKR